MPSMRYELGHLQSVRTFAGNGKLERLDDDGIYLKHELQHNSEDCDEINEVLGGDKVAFSCSSTYPIESGSGCC